MRTCLPAALLAALTGTALSQQRIPLRDGWELAPQTITNVRPDAGWRTATVPSTSARADRSRALATTWADPGGVRRIRIGWFTATSTTQSENTRRR